MYVKSAVVLPAADAAATTTTTAPATATCNAKNELAKRNEGYPHQCAMEDEGSLIKTTAN